MTTSEREIATPPSNTQPIAAPADEAAIAADGAFNGSPVLPARRISFLAWSAAGAAGIALWVVILRMI